MRQQARCTNEPPILCTATVRESTDHTAEINRHVLPANLRFRRYSLPLYLQPTAPLWLKVRKFKAEEMDTTLVMRVSRGAPPWAISPYCGQLTTDCSSAASDGSEHLVKVIICFYTQNALAKTGREEVETTARKRRILFADFEARMGNQSLPKRVMLGGLEGGKAYLGGQEQDWMRVSNATYRRLTCPLKRSNGRWKR